MPGENLCPSTADSRILRQTRGVLNCVTRRFNGGYALAADHHPDHRRGWCLAFEVGTRLRFRPIAARSSREREWLDRFPGASAAAIREFLLLFTDELGVRRQLARKLQPDDCIMDVYWTMYPPRWSLGDQCELESFALSLKKRYGLVLEAIWRNDLSLGDVFGEARLTA